MVDVDISAVTVNVRATFWDNDIDGNPPPPLPQALRGIHRSDYGGAKLDNRFCIIAVVPLIHAPSQASANAAINKIPQKTCPVDQSVSETVFAGIEFQPDGTYIARTVDNGVVTEYGWTIVVQDERGGRPDYHLVELYPTGLIRRVINISNEAE